MHYNVGHVSLYAYTDLKTVPPVITVLWDAGERRSPTSSLFRVAFPHLKYPKDARKR